MKQHTSEEITSEVGECYSKYEEFLKKLRVSYLERSNPSKPNQWGKNEKRESK
jgi:hypothetical protein